MAQEPVQDNPLQLNVSKASTAATLKRCKSESVKQGGDPQNNYRVQGWGSIQQFGSLQASCADGLYRKDCTGVQTKH
jgi:hypothetical protein